MDDVRPRHSHLTWLVFMSNTCFRPGSIPSNDWRWTFWQARLSDWPWLKRNAPSQFAESTNGWGQWWSMKNKLGFRSSKLTSSCAIITETITKKQLRWQKPKKNDVNQLGGLYTKLTLCDHMSRFPRKRHAIVDMSLTCRGINTLYHVYLCNTVNNSIEYSVAICLNMPPPIAVVIIERENWRGLAYRMANTI